MFPRVFRGKGSHNAVSDVRKSKLRLEWDSSGYIEQGVVLATVLALSLSSLSLYLEIERNWAASRIKHLILQNSVVIVVLALLWGVSMKHSRDERAKRLDYERNQRVLLLVLSQAFHRASHTHRDLLMPVAGSGTSICRHTLRGPNITTVTALGNRKEVAMLCWSGY